MTHFGLKTPCEGCPFLAEGAKRVTHLRRGRIEEFRNEMERGQSHFQCHKTLEYGDEDGPQTTSKTQACAGALILMEKDGPVGGCMVSQLARIANRLGLFDPDQLDMAAPVFETWDEMIEDHDPH